MSTGSNDCTALITRHSDVNTTLHNFDTITNDSEGILNREHIHYHLLHSVHRRHKYNHFNVPLSDIIGIIGKYLGGGHSKQNMGLNSL